MCLEKIALFVSARLVGCSVCLVFVLKAGDTLLAHSVAMSELNMLLDSVDHIALLVQRH